MSNALAKCENGLTRTQTQGIQATSQNSQTWNDPYVNPRCFKPRIHQQQHHQVV